jgi:hypothetical protein
MEVVFLFDLRNYGVDFEKFGIGRSIPKVVG